MKNLEYLIKEAKKYADKEVIKQLSYLPKEYSSKINVEFQPYNRDRYLFTLKAHESLAKESHLERYGMLSTIEKLENINDENILVGIHRDDSYRSEFYLTISDEKLISIVIVKSRNKTNEEKEKELKKANKNW